MGKKRASKKKRNCPNQCICRGPNKLAATELNNQSYQTKRIIMEKRRSIAIGMKGEWELGGGGGHKSFAAVKRGERSCVSLITSRSRPRVKWMERRKGGTEIEEEKRKGLTLPCKPQANTGDLAALGRGLRRTGTQAAGLGKETF